MIRDYREYGNLITWFDDASREFNDHPALEVAENIFTYKDLRESSLKIAYAINYCKDEQPMVAILGYRSLTAYSGIPGILYASKAYVPLNPRFPAGRTLAMIKRSGVKSIIIGPECIEYFLSLVNLLEPGFNLIFPESSGEVFQKENVKEHRLLFAEDIQNTTEPEIKTYPDSPAYLLFTSGSTGTPKAVPVSHQNVCSYISNIFHFYRFKTSDRFSQTFDLTFDLSVHDLFTAWLSGGILCIPQKESPFAMAKYIKESRITVWFSVPSSAVMMSKLRLLKPGSFNTLLYSFFCGEPLYVSTVEEWQKAAPDSEIINLYGPTEATIAISHYCWKNGIKEKSQDGIVSIGKIFPGNEFKVASNNGKKSGELFLSGNQVVDGYLQDQINTDKCFVEENDGRWYKTGDLVFEDTDHDLFYLGRTDNEVKISGYRVHLHEIDHVVGKFLKNDAVVTVYHKFKNDASGNIITFILKDEKDINIGEIMDHCKSVMPWYMIPLKIIIAEKFYYNANGKIDRQQLINTYL